MNTHFLSASASMRHIVGRHQAPQGPSRCRAGNVYGRKALQAGRERGGAVRSLACTARAASPRSIREHRRSSAARSWDLIAGSDGGCKVIRHARSMSPDCVAGHHRDDTRGLGASATATHAVRRVRLRRSRPRAGTLVACCKKDRWPPVLCWRTNMATPSTWLTWRDAGCCCGGTRRPPPPVERSRDRPCVTGPNDSTNSASPSSVRRTTHRRRTWRSRRRSSSRSACSATPTTPSPPPTK